MEVAVETEAYEKPTCRYLMRDCADDLEWPDVLERIVPMLKLTRSVVKVSFITAILLGSSSCQSKAAPPSRDQVSVPGPQSGSRGVYAKASGGTSFVFVFDGRTSHRLTSAKNSWEAYPVLSPDGQLVAYSSGATQGGRAEIWIAHVDGSHAHQVSPVDQDAMMPAFGHDGRTVFYMISRSFGHASPIAASRRHDFDVMKITINPDQTIARSAPVELTQSYFYDVQSLSVSPDGEQFLLSVSGYPIGSLILEFRLDHPLRQHRIFQPHVVGESPRGPSFGQALYVGSGSEIVFTAASEPTGGGDYDYNVYRMSEVTGGELTQITHHKGIIDSLSVGSEKSIGIVDAAGFTQIALSSGLSR